MDMSHTSNKINESSIPNHRNVSTTTDVSNTHPIYASNQTVPHIQQQPQPVKRGVCKAPLSKRFAHPCTCNHRNMQRESNYGNSSTLPAAAYTSQLHLYDPASKMCLPTSRILDMLLKECRSNVATPYPVPHQLYHGAPCVYDDLVCDPRRNRCVCKPSLHLYYGPNSSFGCVPIGQSQSPDGKTTCRTGNIFNTHSGACQKIFDVNDLPPTFTAGVSATQFSFVTIVLIWMLLLILIFTAKLRKLRTTNLYRGSPTSESRIQRNGSYRHQNHNSASAWLHPFIAAVNGQHLGQHRTTSDRHSRSADLSHNYNDTDLFLANNGRRLNELLGPDGHFTGSQQSLNNPPPKFEEIYPSPCTNERVARMPLSPPSNEDLPSYDEAMKLQSTIPSDINQKE